MSDPPLPVVSAGEVHRFRHFDLLMAAFVTILLLSNVLGAGKVATMRLPGIGDWAFGAGILFFPISYLIGSTIVGEGVDSVIFYPLAFWDAAGFSHALVLHLVWVQWALKVGWEVLMTPVTYAIVGWLKRAEGVDVFDDDTDFNPFHAAA